MLEDCYHQGFTPALSNDIIMGLCRGLLLIKTCCYHAKRNF